MAKFENETCAVGGVNPNDPLVFTCNIYGAMLLRVVLPTGDQETISLGDTAVDVHLPPGFTAVSLIITEIDEYRRNFSLTLYIDSAHLLDGGEIRCDNTTPLSTVKAGCLISKLHQVVH